jgi:hypothetical protein
VITKNAIVTIGDGERRCFGIGDEQSAGDALRGRCVLVITKKKFW